MKDILRTGDSSEDRALNVIARNSDGAMRDALSLLDQCISYKDGELTYEDVLSILGIANTELLFYMVDDIKDKNLEDILIKIDEVIQDGKDINQFIKDLIFHFRNLLISKTSKDPIGIMDMDEETIAMYIEQGKDISLDFILDSLDILNKSEEQAKWSTQPRIILEMAAIKLINLEKQMGLEERVKKLEIIVNSGEINLPKPTEAKVAKKEDKPKAQKQKAEKVKEEIKPMETLDNKEELLMEDIKNEWQKILKIIKDKKINIYALLVEGRLIYLQTIIFKSGIRWIWLIGCYKQARE